MKELLIFLLIFAILPGCGQKETSAEETVFCMDTVMDIRIWGKEADAAKDAVVEMLYSLESTWSSTDENSVLWALNHGQPDLIQEQVAVLEQALFLQQCTAGAFDPQLYSVVRLWGFYEDTYRVPDASEITAALQEEKWDLGAMIKGYAGYRAVQILEDFDVDRAILNLGGNVQTYGSKPGSEAWKIGVQNPGSGDNLGVLAVEGTMAVVTSGDYQRFFEVDGVRYHHILNPETGFPAESGLRSVTVICADGTVADAYSTALFVMGLERAVVFWQENQDFEAVFVSNDGRIYATEGASLSGCEYEVIRREN